MEDMTVKQMMQELQGLGVKDISSSALKKDLATLLVIAHLSDSEARAIHEFIDKLIPTEPSSSTGAKPLLSRVYNTLFNPVDRMNRLVYELYNRHPVVNWKLRILLYFTGVAFINLWSWLGNLCASRPRVLQSLPRDVDVLKDFCFEVLQYLKAAWVVDPRIKE